MLAFIMSAQEVIIIPPPMTCQNLPQLNTFYLFGSPIDYESVWIDLILLWVKSSDEGGGFIFNLCAVSLNIICCIIVSSMKKVLLEFPCIYIDSK